MSTDAILVLIYLLAWIVTFIVRYRKKRSIDAGSFLVLSYIIYAVFSLLLVGSSRDFLPLKLFPFIYLYIMLLIGMMPVLKFRSTEGILIKNPSITVINTLSLIFIVSTLFYFPHNVSRMTDGLTKMMLDSSYGMDMYNESMHLTENSGHGISNLASIIANAFSQIGLFLTIYYLTLPAGKIWISIGLFLASFMKMAGGISMGQRGAIVEPLLVLFATYFLLRNYIIEKYRKSLVVIGTVILVFLAVPVILITISRFGSINSSTDSGESIYYYLGHENLIFNNYGLDDGGIRYGDRTIPLFKRAMGFFDVPSNFLERRAKYPYLKVNDEVFITYVGDIAIDYGPIAAFVIIVLLSVIITNSISVRHGCYHFHQLLLVHFVLYMCTIGGVKLFPYSDVGGNLKIIVFILVYTYLVILNNSKRQGVIVIN